MSNDTIRGLKNKAQTTAEATGRGARDRDSTDSLRESSSKTLPRDAAGAETGGCSGHRPRPVGQFSPDEDNATGTGDDEKRLVTDGAGVTGTWCSHPRTRRFGRTDARGRAVIEERCITCGRTVSMGGSR